MRWVLLVGAGGFGLAVAGVAWALARWDFAMEGRGETWIDFLPIPMVLLGAPVALAAAACGAGWLAVRLVYGQPEVGPAASTGKTPPPAGRLRRGVGGR